MDLTEGNNRNDSIAEHIPHEVISIILKQSGSASQLSCSTVSRLWSGVALDHIWNHLKSLFPLLAFLGELQYEDAGWTPVGQLWKVDLARFDRYAQRVRSISYEESSSRLGENGRDSRISSGCLFLLSRRFNGALLPQLQHLRWNSYSDQASYQPLFFLHNGLQTLVLASPEGPRPPTSKALSNLIGLPNLRLIAFEVGWPYKATPDISAPEFGELLSAFLATQGGIRKLALRIWKVATDYAEAFRHLPTLVELDWGIAVRNEQMLKTALQSMVAGCPGIERLQLTVAGTSDNTCSFDYIKALFPCRKLTSLKTRHKLHFRLTSEDIQMMGAAWPQMKHLELGGAPHFSISCDLRFLMSFAMSGFGAVLQELHVAFLVGEEALPKSEPGAPRLTALRVLGVGTRILAKDKAPAVAEFLGKTCPEGVDVTFSGPGLACETWKLATEMMRLVHRVRADCRQELLSEQATYGSMTSL